MKILNKLWKREGGYHEILVIALPLIISTSSWTVQHFVDRMFLTWYSPEAIAASVPAGIMSFTIICFFLGISTYVSTFIAQYFGAKMYHKIGPILWQGLYIAIVAGIINLILVPFAVPIFGFFGHDKIVQQNEVMYFQVLCTGAGFAVAASVMSCFYSGRGKTSVIMWINILATLINVIFDYLLIFGNFGFPEMGIKGAAIATVFATFVSLIAYFVLLFRGSYERLYRIRSGWKFNRALFKRLLKFGLPNGVQFFLDVAGFTVFILLIGRLGTNELAATNIAFNINFLAFMPMLGLGMAVSILVGQYIGKGKSDIAERCSYSAFHLSLFYVTIMVVIYVFLPGILLSPFATRANAESFAPIRDIAIMLIRFVAVYSVFDMINIIFASAIKGAGDTRFVMYIIITASLSLLIIPSYIALFILNCDIYTGWFIVTIYIVVLSLVFFLRFLGGKWKSMSVIEESRPLVATSIPEIPVIN